MSKKAIHRCKGGENCHDENHLCRVIIRKDLARIKELVRDSRFYCKKCGRAAHDGVNLCDPSRI